MTAGDSGGLLITWRRKLTVVKAHPTRKLTVADDRFGHFADFELVAARCFGQGMIAGGSPKNPTIRCMRPSRAMS